MDRRMVECMERYKDGQMDGRMDRRRGGWMGRRPAGVTTGAALMTKPDP